MIDRVSDELWTEVCTGDRDQDHPHGKEMQKSKMAGEALQTAVKRREVKSKGEKERYKHLNAEFHSKKIRKPPSVINAKK